MSAAKPATARQGHSTPALGQLVPLKAGIEVPDQPANWLEQTSSDWLELWTSVLAQAYLPATDLPALRRLFSLRDERERAVRAYRRKRTSEGSTGQTVVNPVAATISTMDTQITALEDRFGLNPSARLKLGIVFADSAKATAGLFDEDDDADDGSFDDL